MRINKLYIVIGLILALGLFFELSAHADELNEQTTITFSEPVQIPGQVLPAGTYRFELMLPDQDQTVVSIFNADGTVLYATLQTVAAEREDVSGDTVITLATPGTGEPDLLVMRFYPGQTIGHEFVYASQQQQEIAHAEMETFVGNQPLSAGYAGGN